MSNILILIGGHLCNSPRPCKEAEALTDFGHNVTIGGFWFDPKFVKRDQLLITKKKWRFVPILDFQPNNKFIHLQVRLKSRIAREIFKHFGAFSPELLGYGAKAMFEYAYKTKADLTIVHSEVGLWVGSRLLDRGFKVGVDFEDWFSEDLLPDARMNRPIKQLKNLEKRLINECKYSITTSHSLAEEMSSAYNSPSPTVIYNTFPWAERLHIKLDQRDRQNLNLPSLHWFSQTIGCGRGLETLFQSLNHLKISLEIHLRGNCSEITRHWLESQIPIAWRDRVFIHPTVSNQELLSMISEHDIGLALEHSDIPSRNYTVTNKLFQYLQAGLAIIATDTAGQKEILSHNPKIGHLIPSNNPLALAEAIENLLLTPNTLELAKLESLKLAKENFCWELEAEKIIELANKALEETK
jgi:glycosyltransferase involved in cell wall biosynthesis